MYQFFEKYGKIFSCRVKYSLNGKCKGYGYVQFDSKEAADKAIAEANNKPFRTGNLIIEPFKTSGSREASYMNYNNLFVKNVPKRYTNNDIIELFRPYGEIISAVVIKEYIDAPENKGFGFVCFKKAEDAKIAEEKINGVSREGQILHVCRALSKEAHKQQLREDRLKTFRDCNLYVKELPEDINDERLKIAFSEFGNVASARVMLEKRQDLETGRTEMKPRGFGFVCFNNKEDASKAVIAASTRQILGRMLYVAIAEKKEDRAARMNTMLPMPFAGPHPGMFSGYGMAPPPYGFPGSFPPRSRRQRHVFFIIG